MKKRMYISRLLIVTLVLNLIFPALATDTYGQEILRDDTSAEDTGLDSISSDETGPDSISSEEAGQKSISSGETGYESISSEDAGWESISSQDARQEDLTQYETESANEAAGNSAKFSESCMTEEEVQVTLAAEAGVFSSDAKKLAVKRTSFEEEKAAYAAIEKLSDNKTILFSHSNTYNISVLDPSEKQLQPLDGKKVKISFKVEKIASEEKKGYGEDWSVGIYRISQNEADGETTAVKVGEGQVKDTIEVEADSLGCYAVEITCEDPSKSDPVVENVLFLKEDQRLGYDTESMNPQSNNWMSFIPGNRKLNEINIPCTHDSGTKDVDINGAPASLAAGYKFAQVQKLFINEQLEAGVRGLDIRLNNKMVTWYSVYEQDVIDIANYLFNKANVFDILPKDAVKLLVGDDAVVGADDDGHTLWVCHGKNLNAGTYYAQDKNDKDITFDTVLKWVTEFLTDHPSETVILSFEAEVIDENEDDHNVVFSRIRDKLIELSQTTNPSTGESFLYMKDGEFGKAYSDFPMLKDCRGKVVVRSGKSDAETIGALYLNDSNSKSESKYCDVDEKIQRLSAFYAENDTMIPSDAATHYDDVYSVGTTNSDFNLLKTPLAYAKEIQEKLFNGSEDEKVFSTKGKRYGWVRFDGLTKDVSKNIWETNFFDGMEYSNITVTSGFDCSKQQYKVLKGSQIDIPDNIYEKPESFFIGWNIDDGSGNVKKAFPGQVYDIEADSVSFSGIFTESKTTPVMVIWKDGNDTDTQRPSQLKLKITGGDTSELILNAANNWKGFIKGDVDSITIDWDKATGVDKSGEYYYEIQGQEGMGYVIVLSHTPISVVSCNAVVRWEDYDDKDGVRPQSVTLRLYKNDTEIDSALVTQKDNWTHDFGDLPKYEDGKLVKYTLKEDKTGLEATDTSTGYTILVNDFEVVNVHGFSGNILLNGVLEWDDNNDEKGKRPDSVSFNLLDGRGNIVKSRVVTPTYEEDGTTQVWNWGLDITNIYKTVKDSMDTTKYTLTLEAPEGYTYMSYLSENQVSDNKVEQKRVIRCKYIGEPEVIKNEGLYYTGEDQELISKNSVSYGSFEYAVVSDDSIKPSDDDYQKGIPKAKEAGKYYVHYRVVFEENYKNINAKESIPVTISGAAITPKAKELIFSGAAQELVEAGKALGGELEYGLGSAGKEPENWSTLIPTGIKRGKYYVWYRVKVGDNLYTKAECITSQIIVPVTGIALNESSVNLLVGEERDLWASIVPFNAESLSVNWESSDPEVAAVSQDGHVTAIKGGTAVITATSEYDKTKSASCTFTIIPRGGIWIKEVADDSLVYTGKALKPKIYVYDGIKLLNEKTDYTVSYRNNKKAYTYKEGDSQFNKKKAPTVIVKGKGNYSGQDTQTFTIAKKDISGKDLKNSDIPEVSYSARKAYKPIPRLSYFNKKLVNKRDYSVSYYKDEECITSATPKLPGTYYAKVSGNGNFTGSLVKSFTIAGLGEIPVNKLSIKKIADQPYTGSYIKLLSENLIVKDGKTVLVKDEDYTVTYQNNKYPGTATATIKGVPEKGYIGSKTVTFKIKGIPIKKATITGFEKKVSYNGSKRQQDVTLSYNESNGSVTALKKYRDYTIIYENNLNAGTATMVIIGMNGYSGSVKKTFRITPFDIDISNDTANAFSISLNELSYAYTKAGVKPTPVVKFNGSLLTLGTDYSVSYINNKAVNDGTDSGKRPTVKIKGRGNFKGTDTGTSFVISAADMKASGISLLVNDREEQNKADKWKAGVKLVDENGKKLSAGKDYEKPEYYSDESCKKRISDNYILPASTTVYVKVSGNKTTYTGSLKGSYRILEKGKDISKLKAAVEPKTYTGSDITLSANEIIWKSGGKTVTDIVFEIDESSYKNNRNNGKAEVTVYGSGKFGGSKKITYKIKKKGFWWWWNH